MFRMNTLGQYRLLLLTILGLAGVSQPLDAEQQALPRGHARRWEASLPVGLFSQVNLRTGRVLTTIPVTSWGGRGPGVSFAFYHNMTSSWSLPGLLVESLGDANFDGKTDWDDVAPFIEVVLTPEQTPPEVAMGDFTNDQSVGVDDLETLMGMLGRGSGPAERDWRHSYSAHLVKITGEPHMILIHDDGMEDFFEGDDEGNFGSPDGVFITLTGNETNGYLLTTKSQWKMKFHNATASSDTKRRLQYIEDPSGNRTTCAYWLSLSSTHPRYGKLDYVVDSSNRFLEMVYRDDGRLSKVKQYMDGAGPRIWTLLYECEDTSCDCGRAECHAGDPGVDGAGRLIALNFPHEINQNDRYAASSNIIFAYNCDGHITAITDKDGDAYGFRYDQNRLAGVTDPSPFEHQQTFSYYMTATDDVVAIYHNRRNQTWYFTFQAGTDNLISIVDPLSHERKIAYDEEPDHLVHEATAFTDALDHTWSVKHDNAGNVTEIKDPLENRWELEYDELNNLLSVTPPGGQQTTNEDKRVTLAYEDSNHPTSVTQISEPAEGQSDPVPETIIGYYGPTDQSGTWNGLLKFVTPPYSNLPVVTEFEWDGHGQPREESEGAPSSAQSSSGPWPAKTTLNHDSASRLTHSCNGESCGGLQYDAAGNVSNADCKNDAPAENFTLPTPVIGVRCLGATLNCCGGGNPDCAMAPTPAAPTPLQSGCAQGLQYTPMGQLTAMTRCTYGELRAFSFEYDKLGRTRTASIESNEATGPEGDHITRQFELNPDWGQGIYVQTGPDGTVTTVLLDEVDRPVAFSRTQGATELLSATVTYYDDDRVASITYGNGTQVAYEYDATGRLRFIHNNVGTTLFHGLEYVWSEDGLVTRIVESDHQGTTATTDFTYDRRNRLTEEYREGVHPYHLYYTYDMAGNRLTKVDATNETNEIVTQYVYDVDNESYPALFGSQNNRLMREKTFDSSGTIEQRWYRYDLAGRVTYVVQKRAADVVQGVQWYRGTEIMYDHSGHVWMTRLLKWKLTPTQQYPDGIPDLGSIEYLEAMEYRYDAARARYMVRPREPQFMGLPQRPGGGDLYEAGTWHDYAGSSIHGDYTISMSGQTPVIEDATAHVPGLGQCDVMLPPSAVGAMYVHGNLVGTNERMTDSGAAVVRSAVYTAFGERVCGSGGAGTCGTGVSPVSSRYRYAGAWGYQSSDDSNDPLAALGWLHVGERYYDPASGRFVQRDPIGLGGGSNTYVYIANNPVNDVDPLGLWPPQFDEIRASGEGFITSLVGTGLVYAGQGLGLEDYWDAIEGRDRYGNRLTRGQRLLKGASGAGKLAAASLCVGAGVRAGLGPLPSGPGNAWIGTGGIHGPEHGLGKHVELIVRGWNGKNFKIIYPGKNGWGPWIGFN